MLLFINTAYKVDTGQKFVKHAVSVNGTAIIFPVTLVQEFNHLAGF